MANKAWVIIAVQVRTDKKTCNGVIDDFASYIMPEMMKHAPPAVERINWIRVDEVRNEKGEVISL